MKQYPYILLWGRRLGSFPSYINDQIEKARADNAPQTAIYERDGVWRTIDQCNWDDAEFANIHRAAVRILLGE